MKNEIYWLDNAWPYILGALMIFGLLTLDGLLVGDHINKVAGLIGCFAAVTAAVVCANNDEQIDRDRQRDGEDRNEFVERVKTEILNAKPGVMIVLQPDKPTRVITSAGELENELTILCSGHGERQRSGDLIFMHYKGELKRYEEDR